MIENNAELNEELQIDFPRLWAALLSKKWLILLTSVVMAVVVFLVTFFFITPVYESSAMFYVNNYAQMSESTGSITSSDITASKNLVDSYIVILNTRATLTDIIDHAGVNRSVEELEDMLHAASVNATEIFQVVVSSPDPQEAAKIAEAIAHVLPERISSILEGTSANVVDEAVVATEPSSPSYAVNTLIGFAAGLMLSICYVIIWSLSDVTVHSQEDVEQSCNLTVLAAVPDMGAPTKGGYYSRSSKNKAAALDKGVQVGEGVPFAVSEAYKLLRTKIQFSFADGNHCHVIGVSSAMAGEGKSTSAVNLAYSLAQLNYRVLLMDCDLRRPSIPAKINVQKMPGLTNFLAGQMSLGSVLQTCEVDGVSFHVISSGRIPPNPMELLGSARMETTITALRENFQYIILDLPPVSEVSDALVASKLSDGMLVVVREDYCNRYALKDTVRQFGFVDAKVLGALVNCASEGGSGYGYGKKYYKYGKKYYKYGKYGYAKYDSRYAAAAREAQAEDSGK